MLPLSAETWFAVVEHYRTVTWPAAPVGTVLALIVIALTLRPETRFAGRIASGLLALGWAWTGLVFFRHHLGPLTFAGEPLALVFAGQALLLGWAGARLGLHWSRRALVLAAVPLAVVPLGILTEPTPLAAFTLSVVLMAQGRKPWYLLPLPVAWLAVSAWAGVEFGAWQMLIAVAAGAVATVLCIGRPGGVRS